MSQNLQLLTDVLVRLLVQHISEIKILHLKCGVLATTITLDHELRLTRPIGDRASSRPLGLE